MTVSARGLTLSTTFDGEIGSWSDFAPQSWEGLVNHMLLSRGTDQLLTLEEPAPLSVNGEQVDLRTACLAVIVEGRFCINQFLVGSVGLEMAATVAAGKRVVVLCDRGTKIGSLYRDFSATTFLKKFPLQVVCLEEAATLIIGRLPAGLPVSAMPPEKFQGMVRLKTQN